MSFSENTRLTTSNGLMQARDLVGDISFSLLTNDPAFSLLDMECSELLNAKVIKHNVLTDIYRVQTIEGFYIDATADQLFMGKKLTPKMLKDLKTGDILQASCKLGGFGLYNSPRIAAQLARTIKDDQGMPEVIFTGNLCTVASFLIALYKNRHSLLSTNKIFLKEAQLLLSNYGIFSKIEDPYENLANFDNILYPYGLTLRPCDKMKLRKHRRIYQGIENKPTKHRYNEIHIESITHLGASNVCTVINNDLQPVICNGIIGF